ncbi:LOW QUALITY PROTEIN: cysteine and histidine-rich domain-containing protein 1 [Electrophorus electricus]|uniref:LOW QUALITY PROTEIN: cysteine and histidine-rich domain-containing protein 1 n=1 Tax=Electrophorus electricus TaxID=8005 RepID=UPI0015D002A8|nr:LOW QUALITY PROTEIN: cysteine and histidine-rich domain-containing protein 1 [Electrophorus electricus]
MALLCYNRGCGGRFDEDTNSDDACHYHPGVPIFHDALKGWSCCSKRTTDFSEFLSIKGCAHGRHSNTKPEDALRPEVRTDKGDMKLHSNEEIIYKGPKSAEAMEKQRPSSDEPKVKLKVKVSPALTQVLDKMEASERQKEEQIESQVVFIGTKCKNTGCKTLYQGPGTDAEICTYHPGAPVFHEGYKYWSCCCIKTDDFNAFLDQKGCTTGKHCWIQKQDKKKVACRHDWHQTGTQVVVTIYAKNANPKHSYVEANCTVLTCHIQFENNKELHKEIHLWGVIDPNCSFVSMVPTKVEMTLRKSDAVAWAKLEDPKHKPEPEVSDEPAGTEEANAPPPWDISDDDISDSDWDDTDDEEDKEGKAEKEEEEEEEGPPALEEAKPVPLDK